METPDDETGKDQEVGVVKDQKLKETTCAPTDSGSLCTTVTIQSSRDPETTQTPVQVRV